MKDLKLLLGDMLPDTMPPVLVSGFALDHRKVAEKTVFLALQGGRQHGICFAEAAAEAGASAVLYEPENAGSLPELAVPLVPVAGLAGKVGIIADRFYAAPSARLHVIGVTGTDGKTSVTHFIAQALQYLGQKTAVLGTLGVGEPGHLRPATHTTPDAIQVHQHLQTFVESDYQAVAMEVSSHALDQGRVGAVTFATAVLTNLTRDHLDYHHTLEAYKAAKQRLFEWDGLRYAVLNLDDAFGSELAELLQDSGVQVIGYGVGEAPDYPESTIVAHTVQFDQWGIHAQIDSPWGQGTLAAPLLGRFNLHNLLATLAVLLTHDVPFAQALLALRHVATVPGRMELVQLPDARFQARVVVDYAHTPGALGSVLQAVRVHTKQRLLCVFGCGGDRDSGKRPLMAQVAEQGADQVIVTDDNPRTEDPEQIFADISAGFASPEEVIFEHDRSQAIRLAIRLAQSGDLVLIAGKGHETVQIIQEEQRPFDDRQQACQALQELAA